MLEDKLSAIEAQNIGQVRNLTEQLSNQAAQIEQLDGQLRDLQNEKSAMISESEKIRIEKTTLQTKLNDSTGSSQQQLDSLQETNEKLRLAFLEKVYTYSCKIHLLYFLGKSCLGFAEENRTIRCRKSNFLR